MTSVGPNGLDETIARRLKRDRDGLVPAVVQRHDSGEVLMLAWMDDEALRRTLATGRATYFSRSRGRLWVKGETSGHHQYVRSVSIDCDGDTLLLRVDQVGPACHTGAATCFTDISATIDGTIGGTIGGTMGSAMGSAMGATTKTEPGAMK